MNSFGLNKKGLNTFGLGKIKGIILGLTSIPIRFKVYIADKIRFKVEL